MLSKLNLLQPWNLRLTLVWSFLIGVLFFAVQSGVVYLYFIFSPNAAPTFANQLSSVPTNGILVSLMTVSAAVVCSSLILFLARHNDVGIRKFLALKPASVGQLAFWLITLLAFSVASGFAASYFQQDIVTDFARDLYYNAGNYYLLVFAIVLVGPVFEELFFRGFIYQGLADSRLQAAGAVVVTALAWALVHGQYDWYVKGNIFVIGILFGLARYRSGSILPPMVMHIVMNGISVAALANP